MRSITIAFTLLMSTTGCYSSAYRMSSGPAETSIPTIGYVSQQQSFEAFGGSGPAQPVRVPSSTIIKIAPGAGEAGRPKNLVLYVGDSKRIDTDCSTNSSCVYRGIADTLVIDLREMSGIEHNQLVTVSLTTAGGQRAQSYLKVHKRTSFTGIRSPVLMRASGSASGFRLNNLAPSLAGGMQRNFSNKDFSYLSGNLLVTVYTLPDSEYALSLGGVVDFGGYLQVGPTYHTREKQWNLVIGTRPEILIGLIPALKSQ